MAKNFKILEYDGVRIDRCINCGDHKEIKTYIKIGEGNYNNGPMCKDCYNGYKLEQSTVSFNM